VADLLTAIAQTLNQYGPVLTIVSCLLLTNGFFILRDWRRETQQREQITALQANHNDIVIPLLTECNHMIAGCQEVIRQNSQIIAGWLNRGH
jgi:hypothetical protein